MRSIGTLLFVELYGDIDAITPKGVAKDIPERFALFSALFIRLWIWVLTPL